jgi:hypothetical protein
MAKHGAEKTASMERISVPCDKRITNKLPQEVKYAGNDFSGAE